MHLTTFLAVALGASSALAGQWPHDRVHQKVKRATPNRERASSSHSKRSGYLNSKSAKFAVNGTSIPEVDFDIGESYAGALPIDSNATNENALWFWFFPSENKAASDEIVIWLNGGPGCSSLDGLLQENGPFLWQSGTYAPVANPYSWVNLTNMVWVDQPIGTGLSPAAKGAPAKIVNEEIVAKQFMGFWKNFMDTFNLNGRKVYITGESYAGQYIPYISWYMLMANNTEYYNVKGIQINDPSIGDDTALIEAPAVWHMNAYANIFGLNQTTYDYVNRKNKECGYEDFMTQGLTFPPPDDFPKTPNASVPGCDTWGTIIEAAVYINPCFNVYHLIDFCPYLWDELGFPSLGWGPNDYFNRSDVQRALHVPEKIDYSVCGNPTLGLGRNPGDQSPPSSFLPLPHVIEMTNNVIIGSGWLDYLLLTNGTLITIQNMTWNGARGFHSRPSDLFFVPYHPGLAEIYYEVNDQPPNTTPATNVAGAGFLGITHTERGLTWVEVNHSGHEIPQYVPGAAYRQLEKLLGRIESLTVMGDFTTQTGNFTGNTTVGK